MRKTNSMIIALIMLLSSNLGVQAQKKGDKKAKKLKVVEVPIKIIPEKGKYSFGDGPMLFKSGKGESPWSGMKYGDLNGIPDSFGSNSRGCIWIDLYQTTYQNYLAGNITEEWYLNVQQSWNWVPDEKKLSKGPIESYINFASMLTGDKGNIRHILIDTDLDHDLSDEKVLTVYADSELVYCQIKFDKIQKGKVFRDSARIGVKFMGEEKGDGYVRSALLYYYTQRHAIAEFKVGRKRYDIIISSSDMNMVSARLILASDTAGIKSYNKLTSKGRYITIGNDVYKYLGVDTDKDVLLLELQNEKPDELLSSQVGYRPLPLKGKEFTTGNMIDLAQYKGKYVYIDFWGSWCGPCLLEIPYVKEAFSKLDSNKIVYIGVAQDEEGPLRACLEKYDIKLQQIFNDSTNHIIEDWHVTGYPSTFLINPEGKVEEVNIRGDDMLEILQGYVEKMK